ncbi:hypothetical protein ABZX74_40335 [Streptomyces olivaceoviridis]
MRRRQSSPQAGRTFEVRGRRTDYIGCIADALSFAEYRTCLEAAGFIDVEITATHAVADGMHSAIVRATKPTVVGPAHRGRCGVAAWCTPAEKATDPSVRHRQ